MKGRGLEPLLRDLAAIRGMLFVVGGGDAVAEMYADGTREPRFGGGSVALETGSWHVHLNLGAVKAAEFVEADDHVSPRLYYVQLSNARGEALLRAYFPNPYLDADDRPTAFQPEKLKPFVDLRDRYVGREGIRSVRRVKGGSPTAAGGRTQQRGRPRATGKEAHDAARS